MSHMTNNELLDNIGEAVERAHDLSELMTGTTASKIIDYQTEQLELAVMSDDLESAHDLLFGLARMCHAIEKEQA